MVKSLDFISKKYLKNNQNFEANRKPLLLKKKCRKQLYFRITVIIISILSTMLIIFLTGL